VEHCFQRAFSVDCQVDALGFSCTHCKFQVLFVERILQHISVEVSSSLINKSAGHNLAGFTGSNSLQGTYQHVYLYSLF
jgi:hypothetical protein